MKVLVFNARKAASGIFAALCVIVIIYFGFIGDFGAVEVGTEFSDISYLAVIIDDFGNGADGTKEFMYMDIPFTGAVMPDMPYTDEESRLLHANGKDVIVHMPMEAKNGHREWLGDGGITSDTPPEKVKELTASAINQVNNCIGLNNHMGSKIMESEAQITAVAEAVKEEGLFMVDSLTTDKSKALTVTQSLGVSLYERDVFLDGTKDIGKIEKNLREAAEVAKKKGYAIAIGHVGVEGGKATAQAMKNVREDFEAMGIRFVTLSDLIEIIGDI